MIDASGFDPIDSAEDHIYELYAIREVPEGQHLGYFDRSKNEIKISLEESGIDLTIKQSLSGLNSTSSSTGFICWQSATYFLDWVISKIDNPFYSIFHNNSNLVVVELGTGVSGICASVLGSRVGRYIATDQKHILKLLQQNISDNISLPSNSIKNKQKQKQKQKQKVISHQVDVIEYDWEYPEQGIYNYQELFQDASAPLPDVIIACDTIYNDYLVPYFVKALKSLMSSTTFAIVSLQMRDPTTLENFVNEVITANLKIYSIPTHLLSKHQQKGFVVYYITANDTN
ncbi:putative cytosine deaminase FCY1 [Scheffersomyces amazonensis]|uniref:putative cytosine deaminase FCY1 n=1 Tax=Scheffersomyces amazonensis TaxID=1078765 RepID=UPI00315D19A0